MQSILQISHNSNFFLVIMIWVTGKFTQDTNGKYNIWCCTIRYIIKLLIISRISVAFKVASKDFILLLLTFRRILIRYITRE